MNNIKSLLFKIGKLKDSLETKELDFKLLTDKTVNLMIDIDKSKEELNKTQEEYLKLIKKETECQ